MNDLFDQQVTRLREAHFLILYWVAKAESRKRVYNITNAFDDLKGQDITRTKQTAVACVETLGALCFVDIRDERNRKNLYITTHGARALSQLVSRKIFPVRPSQFLEGQP